MLKLWPALLAVILLTACATQPAKETGPPYSATDEPARVERRILITFADRSINRIPLGGPADYRQRGAYLNSTWSSRIAASLAEEYQLQQIAEWPIATLDLRCVVYEVPLDQSIEQVVESLLRDKRVDSVQRMHQFRVLSAPYARLQTALQTMQIEAAHRWATGRNVTIGMIDTGVDFNHPDLKGQIAESRDFVADDPASFVNDIHGTAVAGIIVASADNGRGIVGVAPDSKMIALKACWPEKPDSPEAVCDSLTLAKALDAAVRLRPAILNLSLTGPYDPLLAKLIDKAIAQRIVVVAADPEQIDAHFGFPASMEHVVAVRLAREQRSHTQPAARDHWILAPGSKVLTTFPHGAYNFISGSSFAAAHVSGVVALLLELQPGLSADRVVKILQATAAPAEQPVALQLSGVVNACSAIANLRGMSTCSEPSSKQANSL
jgi:hypothetical protein